MKVLIRGVIDSIKHSKYQTSAIVWGNLWCSKFYFYPRPVVIRKNSVSSTKAAGAEESDKPGYED